eukprot:maker-scaffold186_size273091-snap-gene-1.36 protein:Tk00916 transcript:maker-scaffold186_size273091-snap-gene-1.36-mRNA-1 annotation:"targeting protein for xklp2 isoform x3"
MNSEPGKTAVAQDGFDCEYNAPQFFDFAELGAAQSGHAQLDLPDREEAEKYFEFDHENNVPVQPAEEDESVAWDEPGAQTEGQSPSPEPAVAARSVPARPSAPAASPTKTAPGSAPSATNPLVVAMRKFESPRRRSIKAAVAQTLEAVATFSPQMKVPPPRNARTLEVVQPAPKAASPAIQRWRKAVNAVTPEVLRHARTLAQRRPKPEAGAQPINRSMAQRLAGATTQASQAKARSGKTHDPAPPAPSSSSHSLRVTRPEPFRFATDHRTHKQPAPVAHEAPAKPTLGPMRANVGQVDFSKMLRSYDQPAVDSRGRAKTKVTQAHPFNFESRGRRRAASCEPTPTKRKRETSLTNESTDQPQAKMAHTGSSFESLRNTKPKPFSFVDRDLAKVKDKADHDREEAKNFNYTKSLRSYPSNETMVDVGVTKQKPFSFDNRSVRTRAQSAEPDPNRLSVGAEPTRVIRAKPMPHFGVPVMLMCEPKKATTAQPFSFNSRNQDLVQKKRDRIEKIFEQEKKEREFKANPMPDLNKPVGLPIKEVILPTEVKPFHHEIEKRVENRVQKWQKSMEEELRKQQEAALFKARPAKVLQQEPFRPEHHEKPMIEISNFELHSDRRARDREAFELQKKRNEADLESMKRQLEERRRLEEEEEIRRRRLDAVHKAQPVRSYKGIKIQPSDKPLTNPKSPKFSNKVRSD